MKKTLHTAFAFIFLCMLFTVLCTAEDVYPHETTGAYEYTYTEAEPGKVYTVIMLRGLYGEDQTPELDADGSNVLYYSVVRADSDGCLSLSVFPSQVCAGTVYLSDAEKPILLFYARVSVLLGDVNGDGKVNVKDNMYLARYLAEWAGYDAIDTAAADLNGDGKVNVKDNMLLARHLAEWAGYETLPVTE